MLSENLAQAIRDYRYLLNRNYPQKSTTKLVGDKYQLNREERSILYRGISGESPAELRRSKRSNQLTGYRVLIDTYNILFTLSNYLNGRPVFISDDGYLRDAGELRGRISKKKQLGEILNIIFRFLNGNKEHEYLLLVDQPVSNSGKLASEINEFLSRNSIMGNASTCDSPDYIIISQASYDDIACTSDSVIIDSVKSPVFDLSFHLLKQNFNIEVIDLSDFIF